MKFSLTTKPSIDSLLVLPIFDGEKVDTTEKVVKDFLAGRAKFGKKDESQLLYANTGPILLIGLGKEDKLNFETLQNYAGLAIKSQMKHFKKISLKLPDSSELTPTETAQAVVIGSEIAAVSPSSDYKSEKEPNQLTLIELLVTKNDRGYQEGLKIGQVLSESINLVRRLADMPANLMTPTYFLGETKRLAKENKLTLTVLDEKAAKKKGMGAFCGVAQGSDEPSFIITLEYKGGVDKEKWGLIGKGITFDSGGISLKPAGNMGEMKYDMCGAATVLATIIALAKLKLKKNIVGVMAVTENLPGGRAQRPGDIVKTYSGKTAEIVNTDAEGRLVLVDAMTFAQRDFKVTKMVDLATLTGAVIIALGHTITGAFGNNPKFTQDLISAGVKVGESFWEMPMNEEYDELIKSDFADMANAGSSSPQPAGSIFGAKFIEKVVEGQRPWIHLDIAGTAWDMKPRAFREAGATGVGVKTLVELIGNSK